MSSELQRTYLPLGTLADTAWSPIGAGVLLVDLPVAWLVTAASLLEQAGERSLAARVPGPDGQDTIVDIARAHQEADLGWLRHEQLNLAVSLFPLQPQQRLKAFGEQQVAPADVLEPPVQTCALGCPPGQLVPIALTGNLCDIQETTGTLLTSSPLLGNSVGGPLLVTGGLSGQALWAGIMSRSVILPEQDPRIPPVRLAEAVPAHAALALIRSEAGRAQRARALSKAPGGHP